MQESKAAAPSRQALSRMVLDRVLDARTRGSVPAQVVFNEEIWRKGSVPAGGRSAHVRPGANASGAARESSGPGACAAKPHVAVRPDQCRAGRLGLWDFIQTIGAS